MMIASCLARCYYNLSKSCLAEERGISESKLEQSIGLTRLRKLKHYVSMILLMLLINDILMMGCRMAAKSTVKHFAKLSVTSSAKVCAGLAANSRNHSCPKNRTPTAHNS
jgi:hypothetical protein